MPAYAVALIEHQSPNEALWFAGNLFTLPFWHVASLDWSDADTVTYKSLLLILLDNVFVRLLNICKRKTIWMKFEVVLCFDMGFWHSCHSIIVCQSKRCNPKHVRETGSFEMFALKRRYHFFMSRSSHLEIVFPTIVVAITIICTQIGVEGVCGYITLYCLLWSPLSIAASFLRTVMYNEHLACYFIS